MRRSSQLYTKWILPGVGLGFALLFGVFYAGSFFAWWSVPACVLILVLMAMLGAFLQPMLKAVGQLLEIEKAEDAATSPSP